MLDTALGDLQELDFEGFEPSEVADITTNYVCAHCYAQLVAFNIPNDRIYIIVCSECATNIEQMGVVSRSTVSIRYEQGRREYSTVIRNLKDLYPTLQPVRHTEAENLKALGF
jgi:hypothetical protein